MLIKKGVDVVHLSSCIRKKDPQYEWLAKKMSEHFKVVGYTHGTDHSDSGQIIILEKMSTPV